MRIEKCILFAGLPGVSKLPVSLKRYFAYRQKPSINIANQLLHELK
jgi:hypothetical protein